MKRYFEVVGEYEELPLLERPRLPMRQTAGSAGYDFYNMYDVTIPAQKEVKIRTGIKVCMPKDEYLALFMRSSMGIKHHLRLVNCVAVIDSDYYNNEDNEGEIIAVVRNEGEEAFTIYRGERFLQGVFTKYCVVDDDDVKGVRKGGTGSTSTD